MEISVLPAIEQVPDMVHLLNWSAAPGKRAGMAAEQRRKGNQSTICQTSTIIHHASLSAVSDV